jgi:hypothetical protein
MPTLQPVVYSVIIVAITDKLCSSQHLLLFLTAHIFERECLYLRNSWAWKTMVSLSQSLGFCAAYCLLRAYLQIYYLRGVSGATATR